jgi:hypothetical protein
LKGLNRIAKHRPMTLMSVSGAKHRPRTPMSVSGANNRPRTPMSVRGKSLKSIKDTYVYQRRIFKVDQGHICMSEENL